MEEKVMAWWNKAKEDIKAAKYNFNGGFYENASYFCQQAVEKALKALVLKKGKTFRKTHDLSYLANEVNAHPEITEKCILLSPVYTKTRYPDTLSEPLRITREEALEFLKLAEEVMKWTESQLQ